METYEPAKRPGAAKNASGQRLGHIAAEINSLRTVINEMRREAEQREHALRQRDNLLALAIDRFSASLTGLTTFVAEQEDHRTNQVDDVLRKLLVMVGDLRGAVGGQLDPTLLTRIDDALLASENHIASSTSAIHALQNTILDRTSAASTHHERAV